MRVEVEGKGTLEFPDGTDPAVIDQVVKRDFFPAPKPSLPARILSGIRENLSGGVDISGLAEKAAANALPTPAPEPPVPAVAAGLVPDTLETKQPSALDIIQKIKGTPVAPGMPVSMDEVAPQGLNERGQEVLINPLLRAPVETARTAAAFSMPFQSEEGKQKVGEFVDKATATIRNLSPKADAGFVDKFVSGAVGLVPYLVTGGPGALALLSNSAARGIDAINQGIGPTPATELALKDLATTAAMFKLPMGGNTYPAGMAKGAAVNTALDIASKGAEKGILSASGYPEQAKAVDVLNPSDIGQAFAMGVAFGAQQTAERKGKEAAPVQAPAAPAPETTQGAEVPKKYQPDLRPSYGETVPGHIERALQEPRTVPFAVAAQTKQLSKDTIAEHLKGGSIPAGSPVRMTDVGEVSNIIKKGTLSEGQDFEGRTGISAQVIKEGTPIVGYGGQKVSAFIVFKNDHVEGKGGAPNEVKINPKTPLKNILFGIDGYRELMTAEEIAKIIKTEHPALTAVETAPHPSPLPVKGEGVKEAEAKAAIAAGLELSDVERQALEPLAPSKKALELSRAIPGKEAEVLTAGELRPGDSFERNGEHYKVQDVSPLGTVRVKDGIRFDVKEGQTILVDKGSVKLAEPGVKENLPIPDETAPKSAYDLIQEKKRSEPPYIPEGVEPPKTARDIIAEKKTGGTTEPTAEPDTARAVKEPWEMTRGEWHDVKNENRGNGAYSTLRGGAAHQAQSDRLEAFNYGVKPRWDEDLKSFAEPDHKDVVQKALSEGKSVPAKVLKDYPDLSSTELHGFGSGVLRPIGKLFGVNDQGQAKWMERMFDRIGEHIRPEIKDQARKFFRTHAFYVEEHPEAAPLFERDLLRAENRHRDGRFVFAADPENGYAGVEPLLKLSSAKKIGKVKFGKDELGELSDILVRGDKEKVRYSPEELKQKFKASDAVAKAYAASRDLVERMQALETERSKEITLVPYEGDPALHDKLSRVMDDLIDIPDPKEREKYMSRLFHEQASVLDAEAQRALTRIQGNVEAILDRIGVFEDNPGYIPRTRPEAAFHVRAVEHVLSQDEARAVLGAIMYGRKARYAGKYPKDALKEKFNITGKAAEAYERAMEKVNADAILSRQNATDAEVRKAVGKIVDSVATREVWMEPATTMFKAKLLKAKAEAKPGEYFPENFRKDGKYEYTIVENKKLPEEVYMDVGNPAAREAFIERAVRAAEAKGSISVQDAEAISDQIIRAGQEEALKRGGGKTRLARQDSLVEGYETDKLDKVLIEHVTGQVGYLNKALYAIRALRDIEGIKKPDVLKWAHAFYKNSLKNSTPLDQTIAKLKSGAVFFRLGGVLKTMVQNGFQQTLTARSEIARFTKDDLLFRAKTDILSGKLSEFDKRVIRDGLESGQTDAQYMRDITGMADRGPSRGLGKLADVSMKGFGMVETELNRKPALLAAMRLFTGAKDAHGNYYGRDLAGKPYAMKYPEAMKKAQEFIRATHYEISKANEPEIVQTLGGVARGAYTFQSFVANNLNWIFNRARHGEVRVLGRYLLATWALGGIAATPFSDEIDAWMTKQFGFPMKHRLRQLIEAAMEQAGLGEQPTLEEIAMNGIPSGALGVNMSKSVQLNTPLPIQVMLDTEHTMEEKAAGAIGGLAVSAGRAATAAKRGDWWRAGEHISPNVVGNIMRGARLYREGATTAKGRPILDEEGRQLKATGLEAAERAAGFMPARLARYSEANRTERNLREYWEGEREGLLDRFRLSFDDKEQNDKVFDEIMKFNDRLMDDKEASLLVGPITTQSLKSAVMLPHGKKAGKEMEFMREMVR